MQKGVEAALHRVLDLLKARLSTRPEFVLGIDPGPGLEDLARLWVRSHDRWPVDLRGVKFVTLQESGSQADGTVSRTGGWLNGLLLDPLGIPQQNRLFYETGPGEHVGPDRDLRVEALGGLDLCLLFPEEDGSVAGWGPGTPFRRGSARFSLPEQGWGLGLGSLVESEELLVVGTRAGGEGLLETLQQGKIVESCPTSVIRLHRAPVFVGLDTGISTFENPRVSTGPVEVFEEERLRHGKNVLFLCPHPDDASISAGGTLSLLSERGRVTVLALSMGHRARGPGATPAERADLRRAELDRECHELGVEWLEPALEFYDRELAFSSRDAEELGRLFGELKPEILMLPSAEDRHPTHRTGHYLAREGLRRMRHHGGSGEAMEIWEWEGPWHLHAPDECDVIVPIPESNARAKFRAMAHHRSQLERVRYDRAARGLARYRAATLPETRLVGFGRGLDLGEEVEVFRRWIWP